MRFNALLPKVLLFLLSASIVEGIFEDEAYQIDYQHALLGTPIPDNTFFHQPSISSRATLLYTLSERNILGAINPKDGSLVWRQSLASGGYNGTRGFLRATNGTSVIVSAVGNTVRSWEAADGKLLWQYEDLGMVLSLGVPDITGKTQDPVVMTYDALGNTRITRLNSMNGKVVWQVADSVGETPLAVTSSAASLYYISLQSALLKGYKIKVTTIEPKTAKPLGTQLLSSDSDVTSQDSILHIGGKTSAPVIVWTDKALKTLKVNVLGTSHIETIKVSSKTPVEKINVHAPSAGLALNHFLIHYQTAGSNWAEVYHVDPKSHSIKKAYDLPMAEGKGAFSVSTLGANVFFSRTTETESTLVFSATHGILAKWPLQRKARNNSTQAPELSSAVTEVVTKGQSGYAVRSALMLSSGDLELIRNGESDWTRHESLAGITKAAWADIPIAENLAEELAVESHSNVVSAYIHRVKRHISDLRYLPAWLQNIPKRVSSSLFGGEAGIVKDGSDPFGFRKVVVVATEKGRLVGLDAGNHGEVLWNIQAVQIPSGSKWNVTDISVEDDLALVMAKDAEFVLIETMTGLVRQYQEPGLVENMDRFIPVSKGNGKRTLIPVFTNGAPGGLPPGDVTNSTFIVTQRWDGTISGWHVQDGVTPTGAWIFTPPEGQRVTAVGKRPTHDPVASIGRALGDRNVLYKYLSTNLVVVAAVNDATSTASIYLLDTVTGETLHSTSHEAVDTTQPISVTFSENWFAYTLHTDPALARDVSAPSTPNANLLVISELFESPIANDRGPLGASANYSSLNSPPYAPHVITASYVIPAPLSHLTTTSTNQGITPRSILAYSAQLSALLAIPASMLSPRRPVGRDATAGEREEGLFPYSPLFDLNAQWIISHKRDILGIQGIVTSPTHMESSSLMFAYGDLDVFGTRIAPIGAFDLLGKGFNKAQLVLTVGALAVGTRMLAPLARKKQIDTLWGQ